MISDERIAELRDQYWPPDSPPDLSAFARAIEAEARKWESIESAPVEQDILIGTVGVPMIWSAYQVDGAWYMPGDDASFQVDPTHWQPLPAPPKESV